MELQRGVGGWGGALVVAVVQGGVVLCDDLPALEQTRDIYHLFNMEVLISVLICNVIVSSIGY